MRSFENFFSSDGFMPHGLCIAWQPELFWLMAISDSLIAAAYYSIPIVLVTFAYRRTDLHFRWILHLFGLFILACGTTHILAIWTLWEPVYWLEALVKAITALVSLVTAAMLWPLLPKLLALPSPAALAAANAALQDQIAERARAEAEVRSLAADLEVRVWMRTQELEDANRQLREEIERRTVLARQLDSARQDAEGASRAKSDFLARMSHELRTPLNAIIGFSELMMDGVLGRLQPDRYREYMGDVLRSGRHLLSVVNDLLDLARIESGQRVLDEESIAISTVFGEIRRMFRPQAEAAGIALALDLPDEMPLVMADERSLRQMLINLIANAVRFTDPGGSITLVARQAADGGLTIRVTDTGVGLAPEEVPHIFGAYGRSSRNSHREGTGLGLPIVKGLIEQHGGTLEFESRFGHGTTVTLHFPAKRVQQS